MLQRDAFIEEVISGIEGERDVVFMSADFGAAALDDLRARFPKNFVHCGISEQAMIDVATGLALEGKQVFAYAMAPFLSLRALEQIKCGPGVMNLPICLISVGVGLGYADSGPTHYVTEEFACLRAIVGSTIYTAADSETAALIAKRLLNAPEFAYVRLDRHELPPIEPAASAAAIATGYRLLGEYSSRKVALLSHGKMVHSCLDVARAHPERYFAVDLIRSKPFPKDLAALLAGVRGVVAVDEQTPSGSVASAVFEATSSAGHFVKIVPLNLPEMYVFENGGREYLLNKLGLSADGIRQAAACLA
jgi:transketolase